MMRRPSCSFTRLLLLGVLVIVGCGAPQPVVFPTDMEKLDSFKAAQRPDIQGEPLARWLFRHVALVVVGNSLFPNEQHTGFEVRDGHMVNGSAIPLSRDGYLLTAAHTLAEGGPIWVRVNIAPPNQATPDWVVRAGRMVWVGDPDSNEGDLALIKIEATLQSAMTWAPDTVLAPGMEVVAAGYCGPGFIPYFLPAAGRLVRHFELDDWRTGLLVTVPIRTGDSGGPLLLSDGQLLGVITQYVRFNLDATTSPFVTGPHGGFAVRPVPARIQEIIERDRREALTPVR